MGTNGMDIALDAGLRPAGASVQTAEDFALAPLVDKVAYGIARGLVVALKELEDHIARETGKVADTVGRRLDILQANLQDISSGLKETDARHAADVEALRKEAKELSASLSQRIDSSSASLRETDARLAADLAALQSQTTTFSQSISERVDTLGKDLGLQQEDLEAVKSALVAFGSRVDALAERLDRQAEAVRSMCAAYSQRETELEQLVNGLARLRSFPTPLPSTAL